MANPVHSLYPDQDARLGFGRTLTLWLERGGWSHDIPLRWGKAAGFPAIADSTFNKLQRGKIEQPYPVTFIQLGLINARLLAQDFSGVADQALAARLAQQRPILHENGSPWTATDFFSHFIGELEGPSWSRVRPLPSLDEAVAASGALGEQFRSIAAANELSLPKAWEALAAHVAKQSPRPLNNEELELLRTVLSGWHVLTPEQLRDLIDLDERLRPQQALLRWNSSLASLTASRS